MYKKILIDLIGEETTNFGLFQWAVGTWSENVICKQKYHTLSDIEVPFLSLGKYLKKVLSDQIWFGN